MPLSYPVPGIPARRCGLREKGMPLSVGVLVRYRGHLLGISRKKDTSKWGLPGGKVDPEDGPPDDDFTLRRAARRELLEETGIDVSAADLTILHDGPCASGKPDGVTFWQTTYGLDLDGQIASARATAPAPQVGDGALMWLSTWAPLLEGPFGGYNAALKAAVDPDGV